MVCPSHICSLAPWHFNAGRDCNSTGPSSGWTQVSLDGSIAVTLGCTGPQQDADLSTLRIARQPAGKEPDAGEHGDAAMIDLVGYLALLREAHWVPKVAGACKNRRSRVLSALATPHLSYAAPRFRVLAQVFAHVLTQCLCIVFTARHVLLWPVVLAIPLPLWCSRHISPASEVSQKQTCGIALARMFSNPIHGLHGRRR